MIWEPLDRIFVRRNIHDRNPWNFPNSPLQIFVAGRHNENSVLFHPLNDAIVSVGSLMGAP